MKQSDTGLGCGSVIYSKPLQFPEPVLSFNLGGKLALPSF